MIQVLVLYNQLAVNLGDTLEAHKHIRIEYISPFHQHCHHCQGSGPVLAL